MRSGILQNEIRRLNVVIIDVDPGAHGLALLEAALKSAGALSSFSETQSISCPFPSEAPKGNQLSADQAKCDSRNLFVLRRSGNGCRIGSRFDVNRGVWLDCRLSKAHHFLSEARLISFAPVFTGWSRSAVAKASAAKCALLFSGACLEEFLEFPGLSGRKICSDSHMHQNRLPLGGREFAWAAGHMAAVTIKRP